ncbi:MAG: CAAX prenyl protease-related protein [bacterium]
MSPYIVPFGIYIALSLVAGCFETGAYVMYPLKTLLVAVSLWYYRREYTELRGRVTPGQLVPAVLIGLAVFVIWILPEGKYPQLGASEFNPFVVQNGALRQVLIGFRLAGAALVVPLFEELFWRSFLIRWIVDQEFKTVPIGRFTWMSFGLTVVFFGLEHHRWLVGLAAGAIYNGLLYQQKKLWPCVLAHGVTNLALGIYVLCTAQWSFW